MKPVPRPGQIWRISPQNRKTSAKFFFIVLPSKKNPKPISKGRALGFFLTWLNKTTAYESDQHFDQELVFLKSPIYRLPLKDFEEEVFVQPFYFFLRDQLENKEPEEPGQSPGDRQTGVWAENEPEVPKPKSNDIDVDVCEVLDRSFQTVSEPRFQFTLRFMFDPKKDKLVHLDQTISGGKSSNITNVQNFFERFIKFYSKENKVGDKVVDNLKKKYGMKTADLLLQLNEYVNPTCICTSKGYGKQDELRMCECGRLYHPACTEKERFKCQRCTFEKGGLVSLSKRDDSQFKLDDLDYSKEMQEYQKEFGDLQKSRTILITKKQLQNFQVNSQKSKKNGKLASDKSKKKTGKKELLYLKDGSEEIRQLTMDQKVMRTFELWNVDHLNIGRVKLKNKKRETMKALFMKGLSMGVCEIMEDLRKYHRFVKKSSSKLNNSKSTRIALYFKKMQKNQNNLFEFLKNVYESGILQNLKDSGEVGVTRYLDNLIVRLEAQLAKRFIRGFPQRYENYIKKGKLIGLNLTKSHTKYLRYKIITKQLTYLEICALSEEDLISEELKKKIEESKEEFWKERELNREARYIIKNHKGDIEMEFIDKDKKEKQDFDFNAIGSGESEPPSDEEMENVPKKGNANGDSDDCNEIQIIDFQTKLREKIKDPSIVFKELSKENTNELQNKEKVLINLSHERQEKKSPKKNKNAPKFGQTKEGNFFKLKNSTLIKGVFDNADITLPNLASPPKNHSQKNQRKRVKERGSKIKRKNHYTPEKIKERMMQRISKTLNSETMQNIQYYLNEMVAKDN